MLLIDKAPRDVPKLEYFNNITQEFITIEEQHYPAIHLQLEHSLRSIAKWESKWHKAFIGKDNLDGNELLDYIRCMTINHQPDSKVYEGLTQEDLIKIIRYMEDDQSAWIIDQKKRKKRTKSQKPDTVEKIYYAMIQLGIPMECENWHFNRLMALIDYCDCQGGSSPGGGSPAKRSQKEIMEMYRAMNERNRKKYHSKG